ncbi:asparaginase [Falcatimonas sp. MSJ-15]|uniref:asparaginase n=1 Tax=Falcatimonas sp. MSJ-15 TaxID=2841515 RepID=UPI001C108228|nr:asparaginase [Falcatimonas sp. MSJ-15]MBU5469010.1 asparaginase [Falcatimonas sp. MSJ-15]
MNNRKKRIHIIATGGTIAGKGLEGVTAQYRACGISIDSLVSEIPSTEHLAELTYEQMINVDSNNITYDNWLNLAKRVNELAKSDDIDGFVITHGTDTMDETAYFLNLVLKTNKPIVLTGAMRPATATSPDGPMNLYQAIALASSNQAVGKGVLVVFSDGIYSGRDVQKVNNFKTDAFNERDFACLGYMRDDKPYFFYESIKTHTTDTVFDITNVDRLPQVSIIYFYLGAPVSILDYYAKNNDGLVIAGTGNGSYSDEWIEKVSEISDKKGIPVVRSSRVGSGMIIKNKYMDKSPNCIPANSLVPHKARILLSLALTRTNSIEEITAMFKQY